jgi:hypothetical protein
MFKLCINFVFFKEKMGFEPMVLLRTIVFKTITLDHSDTSPKKLIKFAYWVFNTGNLTDK